MSEDLQLPLSVIQRIIKESLPPNAIAKQEAKHGISKASSVFILFLTSGKIFLFKFKILFLICYCIIPAATEITSSKNQKTMSADHVLAALKDIEFHHLIPELESQLSNYRKIMKEKKDRKSVNGVASNEKATEEDLDDVEIIDD